VESETDVHEVPEPEQLLYRQRVADIVNGNS
jgi:hypothetical protein